METGKIDHDTCVKVLAFFDIEVNKLMADGKTEGEAEDMADLLVFGEFGHHVEDMFAVK